MLCLLVSFVIVLLLASSVSLATDPCYEATGRQADWTSGYFYLPFTGISTNQYKYYYLVADANLAITIGMNPVSQDGALFGSFADISLTPNATNSQYRSVNSGTGVYEAFTFKTDSTQRCFVIGIYGSSAGTFELGGRPAELVLDPASTDEACYQVMGLFDTSNYLSGSPYILEDNEAAGTRDTYYYSAESNTDVSITVQSSGGTDIDLYVSDASNIPYPTFFMFDVSSATNAAVETVNVATSSTVKCFAIAVYRKTSGFYDLKISASASKNSGGTSSVKAWIIVGVVAIIAATIMLVVYLKLKNKSRSVKVAYPGVKEPALREIESPPVASRAHSEVPSAPVLEAKPVGEVDTQVGRGPVDTADPEIPAPGGEEDEAPPAYND